MPIYEYECGNCGERIERLQGVNDPPAEECPECGKPALQRLISAPAFQFKGSGWYVTDYARKSDGSAEGDSGGKGEDGGKASKDSESKTPKSSESSGDSTSSKSD